MVPGGGGVWYVLKVDVVDSLSVGMSLTNICLSVLTSISYGEKGENMKSVGICGVVKGVNSCALWGLLKLKPKCESIEADRVRSRGSEKVADVGRECERPGGELIEV
jgi:hypothetical protein